MQLTDRYIILKITGDYAALIDDWEGVSGNEEAAVWSFARLRTPPPA